jgi:hypothetical protein
MHKRACSGKYSERRYLPGRYGITANDGIVTYDEFIIVRVPVDNRSLLCTLGHAMDLMMTNALKIGCRMTLEEGALSQLASRNNPSRWSRRFLFWGTLRCSTWNISRLFAPDSCSLYLGLPSCSWPIWFSPLVIGTRKNTEQGYC